MSDDESRHTMTNYDTLPPTQRAFVLLRARGKSVAYAAKEVGVARNTPATNWDMDLINAAIFEVQQRMIDSPIDAIGHLIPKAVAVVDKALDSDDLAAAKEVFDRAWGKPTQRQEMSGPNGGPIPIQDWKKTADERLAQTAETLEAFGDAAS